MILIKKVLGRIVPIVIIPLASIIITFKFFPVFDSFWSTNLFFGIIIVLLSFNFLIYSVFFFKEFSEFRKLHFYVYLIILILTFLFWIFSKDPMDSISLIVVFVGALIISTIITLPAIW